MRTRRVLAYAWAAPTSCLGLVVVACAGARVAWRSGVLEAHGRGIALAFDMVAPGRGILAMTLGHVVIGRDGVALDETRAHERVHVAQCERWGVAFVPAYVCASAVAWLRGGDIYADNVFEREAWRLAPVGSANVETARGALTRLRA
jgi:hypothetical protein